MDVYIFVFMILIVLFSYTIGTIAGFGNNILALPFMLFFYELYFVRPLLTLLGFLFALIVFVSTYKHINKKVFFTILYVMGAGLPIGIWIYSYLNRDILLIIVGIFTLFVSTRGIINTFFRFQEMKLPNWIVYIALFSSGILHGAFTTGGPLLIVYSSQKIQDKTSFRATQIAIWSIMNLALVLQLFIFVPKHAFRPGLNEYKIYGLFLPVLLIAIILGKSLEKRVSQLLFRRLIYVLLFISACSILIMSIF